MRPGKSRFAKVLAGFAILLGAAAAVHGWWLPALGRLLVDSEPPQNAELVVVLAGDWYGGRILKGGDLVKQGYAPRALVSSPDHHYGVPEAELAIGFAARKGYSRELFEAFPIRGNSTVEEAEQILGEVRRRSIKKLLLVTSNFHTRRARQIYRRMGDGLEIHVTAAPYASFQPENWWRSREGRKVWLLEFTKLVTGVFGI